MRVLKLWELLWFATFLLTSVTARASVFSFSDPIGDNTGIVDVTLMVINSDQSTGDYTVDITADASNPFIGNFRINLNLFDVTRNEFFQDSFNDFNLLTDTTVIHLSGSNSTLASWQETDIIATSTFDGFGNPPGSTLFRSAVSDLPLQPACASEDIIGLDGCSSGPVVPEPASFGLVGSAIVGLWRMRRRRGDA